MPLRSSFMKHLVVLLLVFPTFALSAATDRIAREGAPAESTASTAQAGRFAGWLLATSDEDWVQQWNMPSDSAPRFTEASRVAYGDSLTVLIFFANPTPNSAGDMELSCDIEVRRPDGSYSINEKDLHCANRKVPRQAHHVQLAAAVVTFDAESDDPPGTWTVSVTLTDNVAGIDFPLETSFELFDESE